MNHAPSKKTATRRPATRAQKSLLPLVAVGGSLAGMPASAIELGDMVVQSRLGQPLRASIAYVLGPQEMISSNCVSLGSGVSDSGFPGIGQATLSVADGIIRLTGSTPVREPMVAAKVIVKCPSMVKLSREYILFIDPVGRVAEAQTPVAGAAAMEQSPVAAAGAADNTTPARKAETAAPARRPAVATTPRRPTSNVVQRAPIGKSSRYQVQPGDSLSRIAERIENRPIGLWSAVDVIFEANPEAFIDNDPNKLMAGSWLTIPSFDGSAPVVAESVGAYAQGAAATYAAEDVVVGHGASEVEVEPQIASEGSTESVSEIAAAVTAEAEAVIVGETQQVFAEEAVTDASNDLAPAELAVEADNPFVDSVTGGGSNIVIPDTELDGPTTTSSTPNVPTAVINTSAGESSPSWLLWLAGTGLAVIIGLLLFGRLFRGRGDDALVVAPRYDNDARPLNLAHAATEETEPDIVVTVQDDAPTEENLALDADLSVGSDLGTATEMDAAQDFGFAAPTEVDFELPPHSDTIAEEEPIVTNEVLPEDEDYDLSVIIDATKMPQPEDITRHDLKAIEVNPDDTSVSGSYTINKEVDFDILAQDYEDEFTATQAVNTEISRAASELINDLGADSTDAWMTTEETVLMTEEEETAMMAPQDAGDDTLGTLEMAEDVTAEMPIADGATGVTAEMPIAGEATGVTAEMPIAEASAPEAQEELSINETGTIERLLAEDYTLEMATAENDEDTGEMELEDEDTVDTKAL